MSEIEEILAIKRGDVQLIEVLRNQGQVDVRQGFETDLQEAQSQIAGLDRRIQEAEKQMVSLISKERTDPIYTRFHSVWERILARLDVVTPKSTGLRSMTWSTKESGSDVPRAVLAYFLALQDTIGRHSESTFCPLVVDSPKQQDLDQDNWLKVLRAPSEERFSGSQLILGTTDDSDVDFGGTVVELEEKYALLRPKEFSDAGDDVLDLLEKGLKESRGEPW